MTKSEKFASDVQRIKKQSRSGDSFDMNGALKNIERLFAAQEPQCKGLAAALFDWWKNEFARGPELEGGAVEKLCDLQAFLCGEETSGALSTDDWRRVKDEVGYEAENLPLDLLSAMMKTVVERGGMN